MFFFNLNFLLQQLAMPHSSIPASFVYRPLPFSWYISSYSTSSHHSITQLFHHCSKFILFTCPVFYIAFPDFLQQARRSYTRTSCRLRTWTGTRAVSTFAQPTTASVNRHPVKSSCMSYVSSETKEQNKIAFNKYCTI